MKDPRVVIEDTTGLRTIIGTLDLLGGTAPANVAWGNFRQGNLAKVEKTYVLYREVVAKPDEEDGA
jgi:hypothetical protein